MTWLKSTAIFIVLLACFVVGALAVNQEEISLKFAIWETAPHKVFWWLLATFLVGFLLGAANALWMNVKRRLEARRLRRELERANSELSRLRATSLQD